MCDCSAFFPSRMEHTVVEWSLYGIACINCKNSFMLYQAVPSSLSFIQTVKMLDSFNPILMKFHKERPFLAIADDSCKLILYDIVKAEYVSKTKLFPEKNMIVDMKWAGDVLLCLLSSSILIAVDFFNTENGEKNISFAKILWRVALDVNYDKLIVDPINDFKCILLHSETSNVLFLSSNSSREKPIVPTQSNTLRVNDIVDIMFHPYYSDTILIMNKNSLTLYEIKLKIAKVIVSQPYSTFLRLITLQNNDYDIAIQTKDNFFYLYKIQDKLKSIKISFNEFKRDIFENFENFISTSNILFDNHFLLYSINYGLILFKILNGKPFIEHICLMTPFDCTSFDFANDKTILGSKDGYLRIINNSLTSVKYQFHVCKTKILNIKALGNSYILWNSENAYGIIDLKNRTIIDLHDEKFVRKILAIDNEIMITKIYETTIGVKSINAIIKGETKFEQLHFFNKKVKSACTQLNYRKASIPRINSENSNIQGYAILLDNREVHIFSISSVKPIIRLKCLDSLDDPVSISWRKSQFVTADKSGKLAFYDFNTRETKIAQIFLYNITKVLYDENGPGLFIHTLDQKLAYYHKNISICPFGVINFSTIGNGIVLVQTEENDLKLVSLDDWSIIVSKTNIDLQCSLCSIDKKIDLISHKISELGLSLDEKLKMAAKLSKENGYLFGFSIFSILLNKYKDDETIPLFLLEYGNKKNVKNILSFKGWLIQTTNSFENNLFLYIIIQIILNEFDKVRSALLSFSKQEESYPIFCIAAAFLGNEPTQASIDLLHDAANSLIEKNEILNACLLLCIAKLEIIAAEVLIEHEFWNEALVLLKFIDLHQSKELIRKIAFHFLSLKEINKAIYIFASIGDIHPILSLLEEYKEDKMIYLIRKVFENTDQIKEYDGEYHYEIDKFNDLSNIFDHSFSNL